MVLELHKGRHQDISGRFDKEIRAYDMSGNLGMGYEFRFLVDEDVLKVEYPGCRASTLQVSD